MEDGAAAPTEGNIVPNQSNAKVIIVNEPSDAGESSQHDWSSRNLFTGPGEVVSGPNGHEGALPPSHSCGSGGGDGRSDDFFTLVQSLEGVIPLSRVNADNDPDFAVPPDRYPEPYTPAGFQGLFLAAPGTKAF